MNDDTIKLLRECNAGVKMGISSLDDVMDRVKNQSLKNLLEQSKDTHSRLGEDTHRLLERYRDNGKEPAAMAKLVAKAKTMMKMDEQNCDRVAAEMVTDGCHMGIKSLYRYLHQYPAATQEVKKLTGDIIEAEEQLEKGLREYL
ncbi:MAG: hypothetical protein LUC90_00540 [Lachnospiraceae bacterium]|nr:hypothetical protein [Lachnospiraceae bacterium]